MKRLIGSLDFNDKELSSTQLRMPKFGIKFQNRSVTLFTQPFIVSEIDSYSLIRTSKVSQNSNL